MKATKAGTTKVTPPESETPPSWLSQWTTYDGRNVRFEELDNFHLVNLLHYVKRQADKAASNFVSLAGEDMSPDILFIAKLLDNDWATRYSIIRNILKERGFYV